MQQKLQIPIGAFANGTVVKLYFPMQENHKKSTWRPAIIIERDPLTATVALLKATTHEKRGHYDYELSDWEQAGFSKPTVVRCDRVLHISVNDYCKYQGILSDYDIFNVTSLYTEAVLHGDAKEHGES